MKIASVNEYGIQFDNGTYIKAEHEPTCCEYNYADFEQLEESALEYDFDEKHFVLESCEYGFRFGDDNRKFFIPCYSEQNGYYTDDVDVYYKCSDHTLTITVDGEWIHR